MILCVNIYSLSLIMTRVEKYRRYREQISNMKFEVFTKKSNAAKQIERIHDSNRGNKLGYEEVMEIQKVYDTDAKTHKKHVFKFRKQQFFYCLIAFLVIAIILIALIKTGFEVFGGK